MAIKKQIFEITVVFDEESTFGASAVPSVVDMLLEEGAIEVERMIITEEILPDEDYIYDDSDDFDV